MTGLKLSLLAIAGGILGALIGDPLWKIAIGAAVLVIYGEIAAYTERHK